ncbi:MAG: Chromatin structure remodeling complex protein sfh1 [Watsoniomyces obsoletus]|nr:MAG: Chromatin structure remodeling complex protein sfh1 [Watsoniomyces obsoletus]
MPSFRPSTRPRRRSIPRAFTSTLAPRLHVEPNAILTPIHPVTGPSTNANPGAPTVRLTKRGTTMINYAEDGYDEDDYDERGGRLMNKSQSRHTRRDQPAPSQQQNGDDQLPRRSGVGIYDDPRNNNNNHLNLSNSNNRGEQPHDSETGAISIPQKPLVLQHRNWMVQNRYFKMPPDYGADAQGCLPDALVPIRLELDIPNYQPRSGLPLPNNPRACRVDLNHPAYLTPEPVGPFRYRDNVLWNLYEVYLTPEQFALTTVQELDFPNPLTLATQLAAQIRQQLEEAAPVVLHPLFNPEKNHNKNDDEKNNNHNNNNKKKGNDNIQKEQQQPDGPVGSQSSSAPGIDTPVEDTDVEMTGTGTGGAATDNNKGPNEKNNNKKKKKHQKKKRGKKRQNKGNQGSSDGPMKPFNNDETSGPLSVPPPDVDLFADDPPDNFKTQINLNISVMGEVFTDKFEWNLLHGPGAAEFFAKTTCRDLGLSGEWEQLINHAIYEQVHRQKKELLESGGGGLVFGPEMDSNAVDTYGKHALAGVRYDPENLGEEWMPKLEALSTQEIERREIDRERQARRQRRETTRGTAIGGIGGLMTHGGGGASVSTPVRGGFEDFPRSTPALAGGVGPNGVGDRGETPALGRGERNKKKKRRFKSLTPVERANSNAAGLAASFAAFPEGGLYGYGGPAWGTLNDQERHTWRCENCRIWGTNVWAVHEGPKGPNTLCPPCGILWSQSKPDKNGKKKRLPEELRNLHAKDIPLPRINT